MRRSLCPCSAAVCPEPAGSTSRTITSPCASSATWRDTDDIVNGLDRISRPTFDIRLSGVGAFGNKKPHALWAGVAPSAELAALQGEIDRICLRNGAPADARKFTPHVTIARLRNTSPLDLAPYLSSHGGFSTAPFKVGRFVLMSSRDSVGGGPYIVEEAWPLDGARPGAAGGLAGAEAVPMWR